MKRFSPVSLILMREISPVVGLSVDEYLNLAPEIKPLISEIRRQKEAAERRRPSTSLIDRSQILTKDFRDKLLDKAAALVDENYAGRSEMCQQFAALVHRALMYLQFPSRGVMGTATYYDNEDREIFRWQHAWVRVGEEAIDGNVDCLAENPMVPKEVEVSPYWGPITGIPAGRRLREHHGLSLPADVDVDGIWWPELKAWIDDQL
jgi:hypothetical protein